jgi:hypothetical protein
MVLITATKMIESKEKDPPEDSGIRAMIYEFESLWWPDCSCVYTGFSIG